LYVWFLGFGSRVLGLGVLGLGSGDWDWDWGLWSWGWVLGLGSLGPGVRVTTLKLYFRPLDLEKHPITTWRLYV
jgi:hypothetical protein